MSDTSFYKLVNPAFKFEWNGKEYDVKKATLSQVAQYQQRASEYVENKTKGSDQLLAAFAIFLVLKPVLPELTEQEVLENAPGDINYLELFTQLGFMNPARLEEALKVLRGNQTTAVSSPQSPTEQDGPQNKSAD